MRRSPQQEAHPPQRSELCEDCNKKHCWLSQANEQPYREDDETLTSLRDASGAMESHSFTLRTHVAHEKGAHKGDADIDPVDASDAKTEQHDAIDVAVRYGVECRAEGCRGASVARHGAVEHVDKAGDEDQNATRDEEPKGNDNACDDAERETGERKHIGGDAEADEEIRRSREEPIN